MNLIEISDPAAAQLDIFRNLTEAQLRSHKQGLFIAESPKVIKVALESGLAPVSLLCEQRHITGDAAEIIAVMPPETPIYTASREALAGLTGYTLTRGVLCAMKRPEPLTPEQICRGASRIVVIDDVSDTTNIGSIFRSAAALGWDGILLSPTACDPLNRRAVRVSMGTVFRIPWGRLEDYGQLNDLGFKLAAFALEERSVNLDNPALNAEPRLAIILGQEGYGLPDKVIKGADYVVKIPMHYGIDSLNVAATAAIGCWQLRKP